MKRCSIGSVGGSVSHTSDGVVGGPIVRSSAPRLRQRDEPHKVFSLQPSQRYMRAGDSVWLYRRNRAVMELQESLGIHRSSGAGREQAVPGRSCQNRIPAVIDHRSPRRRESAHVRRRQCYLARIQRRDIRLPGSAEGSRKARPRLSNDFGHRGCTELISTMGR